MTKMLMNVCKIHGTLDVSQIKTVKQSGHVYIYCKKCKHKMVNKDVRKRGVPEKDVTYLCDKFLKIMHERARFI